MDTNRVTPSKNEDQYGVPQVEIAYSSSPKTRARMKKMAEFGHKVLRRASGIHVTTSARNDGHAIHYVGTCRMGIHKADSIVNANLKTFDHDNLYLCDGSVIPTLPAKHPTLTIMALADRLATHLIKEFKE